MTAYIAILSVFAAILIGFFRKSNTGLISLAFAFVVGLFFAGMSAKDIYNGWPLQLFLRLVSVAILFFMAKENGTMDYIAGLIVRLAKGKNRLLPIFFFLATAVLSAAGPGPIPANSIMIPMALAIAKREKLSDLLMGTMAASGALFGTLSPLSSTGIVAVTLSESVGVTNYFPVFMGLTIASAIEGIILYLILKGYKIPDSKNLAESDREPMTSAQKKTLAVILVFIAGVLFLKQELMFMGFLCVAILSVLNVVDQNRAMKAVPWNTFLMISGVSVLIHVVDQAGGITLLSDGLTHVMNGTTAAPIMAIISGLMSTVSSAVGVVMPTMIPTTAGIAVELAGKVTVSQLVSAVIVGSHLCAYSPLSSMGGLIMANANEETDKDKLFVQLLIVGFGSIVLAALYGFIGLYR